MTRHFEFVSGSSAKFWEISVHSTPSVSVTVRYGRIGTSGQSQTTAFASREAAQKHADRLIAQKLKKGYVETVLA